MAGKTFRSTAYKRAIDTGKVSTVAVDDLVKIWRTEQGDEKSISLADLAVGVVDNLANGLISGGIVQWTGVGYIFNVSRAKANFLDVFLDTLTDQQVTLNTPDATLDRRDTFILQILFDGDGIPNGIQPDFITGTPSATPVKPQINPATQIELTDILVPAASSTPTLTEEVIYDENIEWVGSSTGTGTVVFNSVAVPYQGTYSIEATDIQNNLKIRLTKTIDFDVRTVQTLGKQFKLKASLGANQNIGVIFLDSTGAPISNEVILNITKSSTAYQFLGESLAQFTFTSFFARSIEFRYIRTSGSTTHAGFYLDIIKLEGGINPPVTPSDHNSLQNIQGGTATERYHTPKNQYDAIIGANTPSSSNVFATMADIDVLGTLLTGYVVGANTAISDTNTILTAFQQVQGQINARVSGTGTINYLSKFTATGTIGDSQIFDNGARLFLRTTTSSDGTAPIIISGRVAQEGAGTGCSFFGINAGRVSTSVNNSAFGQQAASSNSSGNSWTAIGYRAGFSNVSGSGWLAFGDNAGSANTSVGGWTAVGNGASSNNTTGSFWVSIGRVAGGANISGSNFTAIGSNAATKNTDGSNWVAIGFDAGRRYNDGTDSGNFSNGVYIGYDTRVGATGAINEVVIGYSALGGGSNTVVIGNSSILSNRFYGTMRIGTINNGTGDFLTKSATGVITSRTAAQVLTDIGAVQSVIAGTGIQISGTAVNPSVFLTGQALSFHSVSGDGLVYRTSGVVGTRVLTAGTGISITNGDGVSGNPTISASSAKWSQWNSETSVSSFDNVLTPNLGSNIFTTTEMAVGKAYVLEFLIDEFNGSGASTTRHRINLGGSNFEYSINLGGSEQPIVYIKVLMVFESGIDSARLVRFKPITGLKTPRSGSTIGSVGKDVGTITIDVSSSLTLSYQCEIVDTLPILLYSKCKLIS